MRYYIEKFYDGKIVLSIIKYNNLGIKEGFVLDRDFVNFFLFIKGLYYLV